MLVDWGVNEPRQGIHGWRCAYPENYGPCDCLDQLVDDIWPKMFAV